MPGLALYSSTFWEPLPCCWLMLISKTTYCEDAESESAWYAVLVAPAAMQFLDVAGEVTVFRPSSAFDRWKPSLPAANTGKKSCTAWAPSSLSPFRHSVLAECIAWGNLC